MRMRNIDHLEKAVRGYRSYFSAHVFEGPPGRYARPHHCRLQPLLLYGNISNKARGYSIYAEQPGADLLQERPKAWAPGGVGRPGLRVCGAAAGPTGAAGARPPARRSPGGRSARAALAGAGVLLPGCARAP